MCCLPLEPRAQLATSITFLFSEIPPRAVTLQILFNHVFGTYKPVCQTPLDTRSRPGTQQESSQRLRTETQKHRCMHACRFVAGSPFCRFCLLSLCTDHLMAGLACRPRWGYFLAFLPSSSTRCRHRLRPLKGYHLVPHQLYPHRHTVALGICALRLGAPHQAPLSVTI